jgi:hypothetical protein
VAIRGFHDWVSGAYALVKIGLLTANS